MIPEEADGEVSPDKDDDLDDTLMKDRSQSPSDKNKHICNRYLKNHIKIGTQNSIN